MMGRQRGAGFAAAALAATGCWVENPLFAASAGASASASAGATSEGAGASTSEDAGSGSASVTGEATTGEATTGEATTSTSGAETSETGETGTTGMTGGDGSPCQGGEWEFGPVEPLTLVNTAAAEYDPVLLPDGKTLLFGSWREEWGGADVSRAARAGLDLPFMPLAHDSLDGVNTAEAEFRAEFSADRLRVYVSGFRGSPNVEIYEGWRADAGSVFVEFQEVVKSGEDDHDPHLSADELRIYYSPMVGGQQDLWTGSRAQVGEPFVYTGPIAELNDLVAGDTNPTLSQDERIIVFASYRQGMGDLFIARRGTMAEMFEEPLALPYPVNLPDANDAEPFLADDGARCELFFASNRAGGAGDFDLYRVEITVVR